MNKGLTTLTGLLLASCVTMVTPANANAPQAQEEESESLDQIVVTGSVRVRQGGAQDVKHFRDFATDVGMPRPESLTVEGLMGEHDLTLPAAQSCSQLFCLVGESMVARLPNRPDDKLFVGLGFASNIDAATWKREPLNLVAVVDQSGSMSGEPLDLVRKSLTRLVNQMRAGDRISIILYGSDAHQFLKPTDLAGNRPAILSAIASIESEGSTNMEEGLKLGYETAFADLKKFKGTTRLMLFTDEQPNTGNTDPDNFMDMAKDASQRGVGLTTIGVGVQFDGALATQISSVRGGNLFFIANPQDVASTFDKQLDTMVSQLAHDVKIRMNPVSGYKISGVFGVPGDTMAETADGAITISVPTAFLSTNGGGIFVSLARASERANLPAASLAADAALLDVSLGYVDAKTAQAGMDQLEVKPPAGIESASLNKAHLLVDEYLTIREASLAFHTKGEPKTAYSLLKNLETRLNGSSLDGLKPERKLVGDMLARAAFYAGYGGEAPKAIRHLSTIGKWEITHVSGMKDLKRGDRLEFTDEKEFLTYRKSEGLEDWDDSEDFEINDRQIRLVESSLVFNYRLKGDQMIMSINDLDGTTQINLKRVAIATNP
jgi:Ca-activated chloride channel family protein